MLQRALFRRRRRQRMIRFERAFRHVVEALLKDAQTLAQLFHFQHYAGVAVGNPAANRHFKVKVFVARVRACFTYVEINTGRTQRRAGAAPVQRFFLAVSGHALRTPFQNGVLQCGFLVRSQTLRHPVEELTQQFVPAARQVMRHAANTEPGRVHTVAGDRFYDVVDFLTVSKGKEDRRHGADVLNKRRDIQQMAVNAEQLGEHHANHVNAIRYGNTRQFFHCQHVRHLVDAAAEVFDTVGIRNVAVPGLTFAHLFSTTVVVTDIRHTVDNLFAIKLKNNTECTV